MDILKLTRPNMNSFVLVLLIFGGSHCSRLNSILYSVTKNSDGTSNVICDCSLCNEKEFATDIWSSTFPEDMKSLTIANCNNVNILIGEREKKNNFSELVVSNVAVCKVTGVKNEKAGMGLPGRSIFANVTSLTIDVPLYREEVFREGVLHFVNVTIENLIPGVIKLDKTPLKEFLMEKVKIREASENAIAFHGNFDSILEIKNSIFDSLPYNFIKCNVTNEIQFDNLEFKNLIKDKRIILKNTHLKVFVKAKIWKNKFRSLGQESFLLDTENFDFAENSVGTVEGYALKISSLNAVIRGNEFDLLKNNAFKGITVDEAFSHLSHLKLIDNAVNKLEEAALNLNARYFVNSLGGIAMEKEGKKCYEGLSTLDLPGEVKTYFRKQEKIIKTDGSLFHRFGNNLLLLWFLTVSFLILLFPIAYFIKIYLCTSINKVFPLEMKHRRLVNVDDT